MKQHLQAVDRRAARRRGSFAARSRSDSSSAHGACSATYWLPSAASRIASWSALLKRAASMSAPTVSNPRSTSREQRLVGVG